MHANSLDGFSSNSFVTPLICLQCSDNNFWEGDVSREVLYALGGRVDLLSVVFSRHLLERQLASIPRVLKNLLQAINE